MELSQIKFKLTHDISGRQAANFAYSVAHIPCNIWLEKDDRRVNAKRILGLLSLSLHENDIVKLYIDGTSEEMLKIQKLLID